MRSLRLISIAAAIGIATTTTLMVVGQEPPIPGPRHDMPIFGPENEPPSSAPPIESLERELVARSSDLVRLWFRIGNIGDPCEGIASCKIDNNPANLEHLLMSICQMVDGLNYGTMKESKSTLKDLEVTAKASCTAGASKLAAGPPDPNDPAWVNLAHGQAKPLNDTLGKAIDDLAGGGGRSNDSD